MKALLLTAPNQLVVTDVPKPALAADEALIRVEACGICGSDVHGLDGSTGRRRPPLVMGHEAAGVVAEIGNAVSDWKPGDRVTFDSTIYCGACRHCLRGEVNLCDNRMVLGVSCEEYRRDGAFAEYVAVPQRILYRLPDTIGFEEAAMVEALSIAAHAARRTPQVADARAVVVGVGMIGLLLVQVLRAVGYGCVAAVDIDQAKLDLALRLGVDLAVKPDAAGRQALMEHTAGRGWDAAFEVVGATASINTALELLRKGGSLTMVGNLAPQVEMPLQKIVTREISLYGSCASAGEYPECLEMIARKAVDVAFMISRVAPLEEGAEWFGRLYKREPGLMKVILKP